ncbi:MAG TPA: metallopeptidase TldD-related protein [Bacillota bacterium]
MMIERIQTLLHENPEISGFKIIEELTDSFELFFIKKELDISRAKQVQHYLITVYKDFAADGTSFKGSATVAVHPTMSDAELRVVLNEAAISAGLVKNKFYPLVKPSGLKFSPEPSHFAGQPPAAWLSRLAQAVFQNDNYREGWLNSAEIFLNQVRLHLVNSEGIDLTRESYRADLEAIATWREGASEIELFRELKFAEWNPDAIGGAIDQLLKHAKERALAQPTPGLKKHTVLLTGEPVREFFQYYYTQTSAQSVYEGVSTLRSGESIQGAEIRGDRISFRLDPCLAGSTASAPFDEDGIPLEPVVIAEEGRLLRYWGDQRHSYYLGLNPTGRIRNMAVEGGTQTLTTLKREPYLELVAFSDFQMDTLTGDFGGEIRLGWYFDGERTIPITGGSISGNIREIEAEMYLSKELQQENEFVGPKTVKLPGVTVTGA